VTGFIPDASLGPTREARYGEFHEPPLRRGGSDEHHMTNPHGSTLGEECTALALEQPRSLKIVVRDATSRLGLLGVFADAAKI